MCDSISGKILSHSTSQSNAPIFNYAMWYEPRGNIVDYLTISYQMQVVFDIGSSSTRRVQEIDRRKKIRCCSLAVCRCRMQCLTTVSSSMPPLSLLRKPPSQPLAFCPNRQNKGGIHRSPLWILTPHLLFLGTCYHVLMLIRLPCPSLNHWHVSIVTVFYLFSDTWPKGSY